MLLLEEVSGSYLTDLGTAWQPCRGVVRVDGLVVQADLHG